MGPKATLQLADRLAWSVRVDGMPLALDSATPTRGCAQAIETGRTGTEGHVFLLDPPLALEARPLSAVRFRDLLKNADPSAAESC